MRVLPLNLLIVLFLAFGIVGCKNTDTNKGISAEDAEAASSGEGTEGVDGDVAFSDEYTEGFFEQWETLYAGGITKTFVIYFAYDKSSIPAQAEALLKEHARHISETEKVTLKLEGHADERGTREYNVALSEKRAKAVERFLRIEGAQQIKMEVVPFGEEKPVKFGHDEASWQENRRVVLNYKVGRPE